MPTGCDSFPRLHSPMEGTRVLLSAFAKTARDLEAPVRLSSEHPRISPDISGLQVYHVADERGSAAGPKHMTPSPHLSSPRSCSSLLLAFLLPTTSLLSPSPNPHPLFPSPSRPLLPSWRLVNHHLVGPRRARRAAPRLLEHSEPWWKFPETY